MTNEQEEPGYGMYEDRDRQWGSQRHHWLHGPQGWSFRTKIDDSAPGDWDHWESVKSWGPFTRIDGGAMEKAGESRDVAEARRLTALDRAIAFHSGVDRVAYLSDVIRAAEKIEDYLRGGRK